MAFKLSILIPVYNEAPRVQALLTRVEAVPFPIERELVAVDDGSTDGSGAILQRWAAEGRIRFVPHAVNQGKGAAIRTAVQHARGDILVVQDADLELDPGDLPQLLDPILRGETEVCYGTRFHAAVGRRFALKPAYWANRLLNGVCNRLNGIRLTDFNTGYKMMTARVFRQIDLCENGFAMEPEITTKIARMGYGIMERPVRYSPRGAAQGKKMRWTCFFSYLRALLRYRFEPSTGVLSARRSPAAAAITP
jgi:glycosyltransferase involved in cell wall biosynthesis